MTVVPVTPAVPGRPPTRVALAGLGWAGREIWFPRLTAHPAFEVAYVVDPDVEARTRLTSTNSALIGCTSVDELPSNDVDLVVVAVPNHLHSTIACQVLRRGMSVFLEKPVCLTSAEAAQLASAEREGGAVLLAGSAARYRNDVRTLCELVPKLGRIRHVEAAWVRARGVPDPDGWFTRRHLAGGGALVDLGWHLLDTVLPLIGTARIEQVVGSISDDFVNDTASQAAWRRGGGTRTGRFMGDVEDTARAFLVTEDGISVSLHASWASHAPRDTTVLRVDGSAGSLTLRCTFGFSPNRDPRPSLTYTRNGESIHVSLPTEPIGAEYNRQLDAIAVQLADTPSQGVAVTEAHRTIDIIERIYDSARSTRPRSEPVTAGWLDR